MHKIGQSGGFLDRLLGTLLKTGLLLMKNVLNPLAKNVLIPLGFTAAASATDAAFYKKIKAQLEQARILMPHHPLTNFEIQKYYQNEPKFNGVYSRNNLPKIRMGHM